MKYKYDAVEIAKVTGDILTLATLINELTKFCVFVDFQGHVSSIDVKVSSNKTAYNEYIVRDQLYVNKKWCVSDRNYKDLIRIKLGLKKILVDNKVELKDLSYTVREEYDYHFSSKEE